MNKREPSIHLELPGSFPKHGIPKLACRSPFKENEITHTQILKDVTCGKCKRYIARTYPKPPRSAVTSQKIPYWLGHRESEVTV